ncbi:cyclophilin-like fold protein [Bosea sp. 47.2.35]|uniref:cyclophilin-like fold protein n=1 Tax=Bosea sp. 47.2.35 TaxID=2969304 RepID=UPI00214FC64B|nr:cyclophilin-like fold protein [Bosea sp. 47.2.35]MCR4524212.1 cyclophilin-like fold protein [Bosea sp. 47.2.35]
MIALLALGACTTACAGNELGTARKDGAMRVRVVIDGQALTATLDDSPAARDFASLLPLDLTLSDYASTEKVGDLPRRLSIDAAPRSYKPSSGDITYYAPWGNLAIFYRDFRDSDGLVRLGAFDGGIDALRRAGAFAARFERAE